MLNMAAAAVFIACLLGTALALPMQDMQASSKHLLDARLSNPNLQIHFMMYSQLNWTSQVGFDLSFNNGSKFSFIQLPMLYYHNDNFYVTDTIDVTPNQLPGTLNLTWSRVSGQNNAQQVPITIKQITFNQINSQNATIRNYAPAGGKMLLFNQTLSLFDEQSNI